MKKNKQESKAEGVAFREDADGNRILTGFETPPREKVCGNCGHWKGGFCKRNAPAPVVTTKFDEARYIARWPKVEAGEVACGEFKAANV